MTCIAVEVKEEGIFKNLTLNDLPGEQWLPVAINGYEARYQSSNMGRIKSLPKIVTLHHGSAYLTKERIIRQRLSDEYLFVALFNGKNETRLDIQAHRVIGLTWLPNPENKKEINHKKGIKTDNRITEIEWSTHKENVIHGYQNGYYSEHDRTILCLCTGRILHIKEASNELGISKQYLHAMLNGGKVNWTHFIRN